MYNNTHTAKIITSFCFVVVGKKGVVHVIHKYLLYEYKQGRKYGRASLR